VNRRAYSISRPSSLSDSTGTLESYKYLGLGTVVERDHPESTLTQTVIDTRGHPNDSCDQYTGLDRFGRLQELYWYTLTNGVPSTAVSVSDLQYVYDADGNVQSEVNLDNMEFSKGFQYDDLNQLTSYSEGSHSESYSYDSLGNFTSVTTDGGTPVARTANDQNEITSIGGATTPAYDAAGNMTGDETGKTFVYDAWNRLVAVKDSGSATLETFSYDGRNHRVTNTISGTTTDLYYSSQWQVLEEQVSGSDVNRYVWSPVYVNAMVLRDRDTDGNGTLDERLWPTEDANWDVTSLVDGSGIVDERYDYKPFGMQTIYSADHSTVRSSSLYSMPIGFQGMRLDSISELNVADHRWYSPTLMAWTSVDPTRPEPDVNDYMFVNNDPTFYSDPSGLLGVFFGGTEETQGDPSQTIPMLFRDYQAKKVNGDSTFLTVPSSPPRSTCG
jgi:RHS repeat-associated protein